MRYSSQCPNHNWHIIMIIITIVIRLIIYLQVPPIKWNSKSSCRDVLSSIKSAILVNFLHYFPEWWTDSWWSYQTSQFSQLRGRGNRILAQAVETPCCQLRQFPKNAISCNAVVYLKIKESYFDMCNSVLFLYVCIVSLSFISRETLSLSIIIIKKLLFN